MTILRKLVAIALFACLAAGGGATAAASFGYAWHVPQPLASTDAAIAAIKELRPFLTRDANYNQIQDFAVDQNMLQIVFAYGANALRWGIDFSKVTGFSQMDDDEGKYYSMMNINPADTFFIASPAHGRKLIDAVATLAIAQNAPLPPYYDFSIATGSAGYLEKVLKQANVAAGAVVHSGAPGSPLTSEDVIVQATYAGKTYPITDKGSWNAACREAVAGKAEETVVARVVRNGATSDKQVKLINYAFNASIAKGGQSSGQSGGQAGPPKGFGLQLRLLDAQELKTLSLDRPVAFLVLSVAQDSFADKMQIREKDVLLAINGVDIASPTQLIEMLNKGPIMAIKVWRDGAAVTLQGVLTI
ncbi:MAG: hypothetical protein RIN56_06400 [Sporomusaceae bacterium]|nr:hypothetical protein [Sporomusaceae bacterium]